MKLSPRLALFSSLLALAACRSKPGPDGLDSGVSQEGLDDGEGTGELAGEEHEDPDEAEGEEDGADDGADDAGGSEGDDGGREAGDGGDSGGEEGDDGGPASGDSGGAGAGGDSGSAPEELCNGLDDDGDGEIDEDACPDTVVTDPDSGVAYMMVAAHMDWSHAQANCAAYGYTLVTIEDTAENDLVWELIYEGEDGLGHIDAHTWIGYRQPVGDSWQWDGVSTSYENFDSEVITDDYGTVYFGQAAAFGDAADMYWHEAPQTWRYASVCESP